MSKKRRSYFDDLTEWLGSFFCNECGETKPEEFVYVASVANGEVWRCIHCRVDTMVDDKPNEDLY